MAVTLKDISIEVGKSVTTVSRALHDYDDVSPKTKAMVRRVADELGYTPNTLAQRLQKQRTDTIGFVLPTFGPRFSDPYFSEILAGIGNQAAEMGYDLLVSTQPPGEQELDAYKRLVKGRRVDGFIIVRTRCEDARIEYLCKAEFPFVAFGRTAGPCDFPYVDEDSEYGMRLIVDHMINLGYRSLSFLAAPDDLMFAQFRLKGFLDGLKVHNLPQDEATIITGDLTQRGGYRQANVLLDSPVPPVAIVASNDLMAIGAMSAAQERNLQVGQDIAITGFDDTPMAEHSHPPLTTVHQPVYTIGRMVCEMLIKRIRGEFLKDEQIILKPSLVIRQSCGPHLAEMP